MAFLGGDVAGKVVVFGVRSDKFIGVPAEVVDGRMYTVDTGDWLDQDHSPGRIARFVSVQLVMPIVLAHDVAKATVLAQD